MIHRYRCCFPGCGFSTNARNQIDEHHLVPISMDGKDTVANRIHVCPSCHRNIYVPGMASGPHSILKRESVVFMGKLSSTRGSMIVYRIVADGRIVVHSVDEGKLADFGDLGDMYHSPQPIIGSDAGGTFTGFI